MLLFCFAAAPRADVSKYLEAFRTSCFIVKYVSGKFPGNGLLMLSGYKKKPLRCEEVCHPSSVHLIFQKKSAGISTFAHPRLRMRWLPGFTGPVPSAALDKVSYIRILHERRGMSICIFL